MLRKLSIENEQAGERLAQVVADAGKAHPLERNLINHENDLLASFFFRPAEVLLAKVRQSGRQSSDLQLGLASGLKQDR